MKSLQAFSCSLMHNPFTKMCNTDQKSLNVSESVRRLNVDIYIDSHSLLRALLYQFSKVTHLHINLYTTNKTSLTWRPTTTFPNITFSNLHTCTLSIVKTNTKVCSISNTYLWLMYSMVLSIIAPRDGTRKWKRLEIWDDKLGSELRDRGPPKSKRCICFPFGSVHTTTDLDRLHEMISKDGLKNVEFLFLNNILVSQSCVEGFQIFLLLLMSICRNLTEINLAGTHNTFSETQILRFSAVLNAASSVPGSLYGLKRLVITECEVFPLSVRDAHETHASVRRKRIKLDDPKFKNDDNRYQRKASLHILVEGCPSLVELDIRNEPRTITTDAPCNCDRPQDGLRDEDLFPILELQMLENLTLIGLKTVARLEFLKDLPVRCPSLKTLRLAGLGPQETCTYWPSLASALRTMNSLQELSIDHNRLPLDEETFWLDLAKVPSLVRLCVISGQFSGKLHPRHATDFIFSVPTIKTLHIHSMARNIKTCLAKLSSRLRNRRVDVQMDQMHFPGGPNSNPTAYSGNFYERQRMCYKGSTVGILIDTCGLSSE